VTRCAGTLATSLPFSENTTAQSAGSVLARLLALCWRHRGSCLLVILCQLALLTLGLVGLGFTGLGIDYIHSVLKPDAPAVHWPLELTPPADWAPMTVILTISLVVVAAALFRGWLTWLAGVSLAHLVHRRVVAELQTAVFSKLQHLSFSFFDRQSSGAIINRATGDIQAIRTFVDTVLIQTLVTVISLAVYIGYMVSIHTSLTLACLATLPALWIACVIFSRMVHPEYVRNRSLFDRMILTLAECVQGMNVIKGFSREREMAARFEADNRAVKDQQRRIFWRVSTFSPAIDLLTQINLVVLLVYGGKLVIDGTLPLGAGLVVFAGLLQQFSNQVSTTAQIANGVQESLTGARRVFEILDAPLGVQSPAKPVELATMRGAVRFEAVSFGYLEGSPVLREVDFAVAPGECVAVVGETGSGKSALLSLIPRFYDPEQGRVLIDGHDVRTLDLQLLRRRVSVVFQESFLFSDTVASNISFGRSGATKEAMIAAARAARAHEFIEALPHGYDTVLGESGVDLSGGQRQRLAIARALMSDPAILLLDDPTAAIDPETEHEILAAIEQAISGRTTFIVAHRLSTLRRADRILVLERGRIVQMGTHAELVRASGPYRRAAMHQMIDDESRRLLAEEGSAGALEQDGTRVESVEKSSVSQGQNAKEALIG
jgi:ATP-binding cassette subfamily B protein